MCVSFGGPSSVELPLLLLLAANTPDDKMPPPSLPPYHLTFSLHSLLSIPRQLSPLPTSPQRESSRRPPSASLLSTTPTLWAFLGESRSKLCLFFTFSLNTVEIESVRLAPKLRCLLVATYLVSLSGSYFVEFGS